METNFKYFEKHLDKTWIFVPLDDFGALKLNNVGCSEFTPKSELSWSWCGQGKAEKDERGQAKWLSCLLTCFAGLFSFIIPWNWGQCLSYCLAINCTVWSCPNNKTQPDNFWWTRRTKSQTNLSPSNNPIREKRKRKRTVSHYHHLVSHFVQSKDGW